MQAPFPQSCWGAREGEADAGREHILWDLRCAEQRTNGGTRVVPSDKRAPFSLGVSFPFPSASSSQSGGSAAHTPRIPPWLLAHQ